MLLLTVAFLWTFVEVYALGTGPTPQLPPEGYVLENLNAKIQWHNGNRTPGYTLQISADDPSFSNKLFLEKEVNGTSHIISDLESGRTYYWRLKKDTFYSPVASFSTANNAINF